MDKLKNALRITEAENFFQIFVRLFNAESDFLTNSYLVETVNELKNGTVSITTAIKKDKVKSQLLEADSKRDEPITNLGSILKGNLALPIAEKKQAAQEILPIFNKYAGITKKSYSEESALIRSLLEDLDNSKLQVSIDALEGVRDVIEQIRLAQKDFDDANDAFTSANTEKGETASVLKKKFIDLFNNKIVPYLTAMNISDNDVYGSFCAKVQAEILKVNATVPSKKAKQQSTEE